MSVIRDYALFPGRWPGMELMYSFRAIDGFGGKLGTAGPQSVWWDFYNGQYIEFTSAGHMDFDAADLNSYTEVQWEEIVMHEIGHVVGLGTLWDTRFVNCVTKEYLGNPFTGQSRAKEKYLASGGSLGDAANGNVPPLSSDCNHWDEAMVNTELMTPLYDVSAPLSAVTAGAVEDLNYVIDYGFVEQFTMIRAAAMASSSRSSEYDSRMERPEPHREVPLEDRVRSYKAV